MGKKRIIQLDGTTTTSGSDYLAIDSNLDGTRKISVDDFKTFVLDGMDLSKISDDIAPQFDSSVTYSAGDIVIYEDVLYICNGTTTGTWNSAKWDATSMAELLANLDLSADNISYDNTTSGLEATNAQGAIDEIDGVVDEAVSDITALETEMPKKAAKDGVYDMVAGNVKSDSYEVDNAPYLYRASKVASALDLSVVGGTVAWNQLVQNGNFESTSGWSYGGGVSGISVSNNKITATVTKNANADIRRSYSYQRTTHKYLIRVTAQATGDCIGNILLARFFSSQWGSDSNVNLGTLTSSEQTFAKVYSETKTSNGGNLTFGLNVYPSADISGTIIYSKMNIIDLTQMFGSTIADYIYSLEQATAGSGIAWLKSYGFLTKSYYAYQSGKLESVNVASRKIVGKNLFGGIEFANKVKDASPAGQIDYENKTVRYTYGTGDKTTIYDRFKPNTAYTFLLKIADCGGQNFSMRIVYTDGTTEEIEILPSDIGNYVRKVSNPNKTLSKLAIMWYQTTIVKLKYDECGIFEGAIRAQEYEPYKGLSYPLDSSLTLRGIPKLSNDELYYDGDVYNADGSVKRKYGVVDLGSLDWIRSSIAGLRYGFRANLSNMKYVSTGAPNLLCAKYVTYPLSTLYPTDVTISGITAATNSSVVIAFDDNYTDASAFKTAMSGVYMVFELITPTTESAEPFENPQLVFSNGTEEFVDAGTSASTPTRDVDIPVGQNSKYYLDIKGKVEQLYGIPEPPSTNGTYRLVCTVASGVKTYSWVSN